MRSAVIAVLALVCVPASAHAATLEVSGGELRYAATPGDFDNSVRFVEVDPDTVRVTNYPREPADPISPGAGCAADPLTTADDFLCDGVSRAAATSDAGTDFLWAWASEWDGTTTRYEFLSTIPITMNGGADRDYLRGGNASDALDAGAGNDTVEGFYGSDNMAGGPGSDFVGGHYGRDRLAGDAGWDALHGGPDDDVLLGGDGTDELDGSEGNDVIGGGADVDLAIYRSFTEYGAPRGAPLTVTLDDAPGDGQSGEEDNVLSDVENLRGGARDDVLSDASGAEANLFEGFGGNDLINPGDGEDTVEAGAGDDAVDTRDSAVDVVACGEGNDTVYADERDTVGSDCERVNPRDPPPAALPAVQSPAAGGLPQTGTVDTRAAARGLAVRVSPARDRRAPFAFLVKGRVRRPAGTDAAAACSQGRVSIAVRAGRRVLTAVSEEVKPDCTFERWLVFRGRRHFPRSGRLLLGMRFSGSQGLRPGDKARRVLRTR